jgi:hypothetical protein
VNVKRMIPKTVRYHDDGNGVDVLDWVEEGTAEHLAHVMIGIPPEYRRRWCRSDACWCLGCSNSRVLAAGFTEADWQRWWDERGGVPPDPQQRHADFLQPLIRGEET